jgi:hypothetical protein
MSDIGRYKSVGYVSDIEHWRIRPRRRKTRKLGSLRTDIACSPVKQQHLNSCCIAQAPGVSTESNREMHR